MPNPNVRKWLLVPDSHYPYEDAKAHRLIDNVINEVKPYGIAILGDFFDFYAISDHSKDWRRKLDLAEEISIGNERLKEFDKMGFKEKKFIAGNHEWRLDRYIDNKAQEVFKMLAPANIITVRNLPQALDLKNRGWEYTDYKDYTKIGKLHLTHDTGKAGMNAHRDAQADFESNVVIGHTHRMAMTVRGSARGETHAGLMLGWLGDVQQVDYMFKIKALRDWSLGFGIAYHQVSTGFVYVQPCPIVHYTALVEGKIIKL